MAAERRASVTWSGDLMSGSGTIDEVGSGAFGPLDVSWPALAVVGTVPGLDEDAFREAAEDAKKNCPVSQALAGVSEITLDAVLG